jgi:hypothetical protein
VAALLSVVPAVPARAAGDNPDPKRLAKVSWKKTVVDDAFRSEGVCVVDVNKDGRPDIIIGDCWYEAPKDRGGSWTRHVLRADRKFDPHVYGDSFACFADDFNGDGFPDVIVIPFPGNACYWYENPGPKGGMWKEHLLTTSACNETPIFVDLFKTGKRVLVMGWQPAREDGKGNHDDRGEMCWFKPGKDPTQPWEKHSISGPSVPGKFEVPGTRRFSHGLGHGDVNGDGRVDIFCTGGWWEQPEKDDGSPWKFHPANLGAPCADMYAVDLDGDGKADIISSSAHAYGLWWHQQKPGKDGPTFFTRELFPSPATLAQNPAGVQLGKEEQAVYKALNVRRDQKDRRAALAAHPELCQMARDHAERLAKSGGKEANIGGSYKGRVVAVVSIAEDAVKAKDPAVIAEALLLGASKDVIRPGYEIGIGYAPGDSGGRYTLIVGDRGLFSLPSATHAMHLVDIDGDGLKDLVTGRRYWAHAPDAKGGGGDAGVNDPAVLCWFRAHKDKSGLITFTPEVIDEDSGVGTQFEVADINGDGLLDIIIANKRGVFIFEQVRAPGADAVPPKRE